MIQLCRKLRSRKGTTLVEVLCAVVVIAMSSAFFAAAVSAAGRLNIIARESEEKLYTALGVAEAQADTDGYENSAITLKVYRVESSGETENLGALLFEEEIELYGEADSLLSFRAKQAV